MLNDKKRMTVDKDFEKNLIKLYPYRSFRQATKELNEILQEMLYGKKKKK